MCNNINYLFVMNRKHCNLLDNQYYLRKFRKYFALLNEMTTEYSFRMQLSTTQSLSLEWKWIASKIDCLSQKKRTFCSAYFGDISLSFTNFRKDQINSKSGSMVSKLILTTKTTILLQQGSFEIVINFWRRSFVCSEIGA